VLLGTHTNIDTNTQANLRTIVEHQDNKTHHAAHMGEKSVVEKPQGKNHSDELSVDGKIIL
jgi:hypothetical protein